MTESENLMLSTNGTAATPTQFPAGTLYVVATPIGNLQDITLRALACLREVEWIAAEDTRISQRLLAHYQLQKPIGNLLAVHEHNERSAAEQLITRLQAGDRVALITDAGTPAISDPGARVVDSVRNAHLPVVPLPGASAGIAALSAAGLPPGPFHFEGFLPPKAQARRTRLKTLLGNAAHVVIYESPHRIAETLADLQLLCAATQQIVIARELSKRFEQIVRLNASALNDWIMASADHQRGEFVVMISAADQTADTLPALAYQLMDLLIPELPPSKAATIVAQALSCKKDGLYQYALQKKQRD